MIQFNFFRVVSSICILCCDLSTKKCSEHCGYTTLISVRQLTLKCLSQQQTYSYVFGVQALTSSLPAQRFTWIQRSDEQNILNPSAGACRWMLGRWWGWKNIQWYWRGAAVAVMGREGVGSFLQFKQTAELRAWMADEESEACDMSHVYSSAALVVCLY